MRQLLQLCITASVGLASVSLASSTAQVAVSKAVTPEVRPFYRGSSVAYRNTVSTFGLDPGAAITPNPYYGMQLAFQPRAWFNDVFYVRASFDVATELTQADWTNDRFFISDLGLAAGADGLYTIPWVDVDVSAELALGIPTSIASRASSRILATSASLSLSRKFGPVSLSYSGGFDKYWNEYITGAPTASLKGVCPINSNTNCVDVLIQSGVRNASWSMSHGLSAGYKARPWLSFGLGMGLSTAHLYALPAVSEISHQVQDPADVRFYVASSASVTVKPNDLMTFTLGGRSVHAQLGPYGYRAPFFNRFTQLYLDVGFSVASLISRLKS